MLTNLSSRAAASAPKDDLLTRVGGGDQVAFAEFYDLTVVRVLGLVRRVLKDSAQSEEVTQDVFLELWQTATRFDSGKGRAASWAMTVARRRAIDRVRASQSSRDRDRKVGIRDHEAPRDDVAEAVDTALEHRRVLAAMAGISAVQREAIQLAYTEGLTQSEMALRTGVPVGTMKTRLRDGLIALRKQLNVAA